MDHTTVVAGLMAREIGFLLQQQKAQAGMSGGDFQRGSQTEDATADDRQVIQRRHGRFIEVSSRRFMPDILASHNRSPN
jgi:hypothetical protein